MEDRRIEELTDQELRERPSTATAKEIERRALRAAIDRRRGAGPQAADPMAAARRVAVAHTAGSRSLVDAMAPRAPHGASRAVVTNPALVARSTARVAENHTRFLTSLAPGDQHIERRSVAAPRRTGRPGDPWARLVGDAGAAGRADLRSDHGPAMLGPDPDTTEAETRALGGVTVAKVRS